MRLAKDRSRGAGGAAAGAGVATAAEAGAPVATAESPELLESVEAVFRREARAVERTISVCDLRRTGMGELTGC